MESRRIVYYGGNTVRRSYSKQSVVKRYAQEKPVAEPKYVIPRIDKVFLTKNCMWCFRDFDKFRLSCDICHNCQYCGMVNMNPASCEHCGNHYPAELEPEIKPRRVIRFL